LRRAAAANIAKLPELLREAADGFPNQLIGLDQQATRRPAMLKFQL
jgi:hypothetical protein